MTDTTTTTADATARRRRIARVQRALKAARSLWARQTIEISVAQNNHADGRVTRRRISIEADVLGGLAVHRDHNYDPDTGAFDTWTVTHVQSGLAPLSFLPNERHARIAVVRLLTLTDWHQSQESMRSAWPVLRQAVADLYDDPFSPGADDEEGQNVT